MLHKPLEPPPKANAQAPETAEEPRLPAHDEARFQATAWAEAAFSRFEAAFSDDRAASALHAIVDQLPLACLIKDETLRYTIVNRQFCQILHIRESEMLGKTALDLFEEDLAKAYESRERRVLETGEMEEFEEDVERWGSPSLHAITRVRRITDETGRRFVCVTLYDVTELKMARDAAEQADRVKTQFLATISHELRTPLNGVLGLTELLKLEPLTAQQHELVKVISASGQTLVSLISDLLDMSTIEAGELRLDQRPFAVADIVEDVAKLMTPSAAEAGLVLFMSSGPKPPQQGYGDAERIKQILSNFVNNAIKFTDEGHVEIRIDGDVAEDRLRLSVIDTGVGLTPEECERVFSRFARSSEHQTRPRPGVGLGLSICKSLAKLMGGDVHVESRYGEGSVFTLEIPLGSEHARPDDGIAPTAPLTIEVQDAFAPRKRGWSERLRSLGHRVVGSDHDGARIRMIVLETADIDGVGWMTLSRSLAARAPALVAVPQASFNAIENLTDANGRVIYITRPAHAKDVIASLDRLAPFLHARASTTPGQS